MAKADGMVEGKPQKARPEAGRAECLRSRESLEVRIESFESLSDYSRIPIRFSVCRIYHVVDDQLVEATVPEPWETDYDLQAGHSPVDLPRRFDVSSWGCLTAWLAEERVGGALVAWNTPGVDMLEGRDDLAVLWDLRVAPRARGMGAGTALFSAVEAWARARGCCELKVETQNVNVPACEFYQRQGCRLSQVRRDAYPDLPGEIQLIWSKALT